MQLWIDPNGTLRSSGPKRMIGTPGYLEIQEPLPVGGRGISHSYVIFLKQGSYVTAACWDHEFDRFVPYILDERLGIDWINAYAEAWPTFGRLLGNTIRGRLSDGCLVNFEDPDDGESKWFVN